MTRLDEADGTSATTGTDARPTGGDGARVDAAGVDDGVRDPAAAEALQASRATLYGAVGGAFCYPDEAMRATLTDDDARDGVLQAAERLGLRAEAERFLDAVADASVSDLESAYNALFGLPDGGEYPVVPYEAHYTTGSDVGESQRRIATVVGLMETFGVEPGESFAERQDHVAAELELMQVITAQRAVAIHEGDGTAAERLADAEATVLDEHLVEFVPAFAHDVERTVGDDDGPGRRAYRASATLAADLVRRDHADSRADGDTDDASDADHADAGASTEVSDDAE
ncbi:TorD/DmsD family molecular chaperone [Halosimplex salinum]|uniref:TorD/DmsD family molecular chaperone n=1 Tax=Halosimplex salinum TaxID=1710538 RepID=UPI000F46A292|nr:molecular chaperone TorD family protein [Halosimplex salinum]